jgi:hypothetical protein
MDVWAAGSCGGAPWRRVTPPLPTGDAGVMAADGHGLLASSTGVFGLPDEGHFVPDGFPNVSAPSAVRTFETFDGIISLHVRDEENQKGWLWSAPEALLGATTQALSYTVGGAVRRPDGRLLWIQGSELFLGEYGGARVAVAAVEPYPASTSLQAVGRWLVLWPGGTGYRISADGGETWSDRVDLGGSVRLAADGEGLVALVDGAPHRSLDGVTWTAIPAGPGGPAAGAHPLWCDDGAGAALVAVEPSGQSWALPGGARR